MNKCCWRHLALSLAIGITLPAVAVATDDPFAELEQETRSFSSSPTQDAAQTDGTTESGGKVVPAKKHRSEADEFEAFRKQQLTEYAEFKRKLMAEFEEYKRITQEETRKYQQQLSGVWDKPEVSGKKVWVDYSEDLKQRNKVDFENGAIEIAMTYEKGQQASQEDMRQALAKLLQKNKAQAYQDDTLSQSIEKRSKEKISLLQTAEVKPAPILVPYLTGKETLSEQELDSLVDHMIQNQELSQKTNKKGKTVVTLKVPLTARAGDDEEADEPASAAKPKPSGNTQTKLKKPKPMPGQRPGQLPKPAQALNSEVTRYASKADVEKPLVFAIIETESAFNPMARSAVPAYGLMQIVPTSAGQDATEALFGKARILSPSYLYNGDQNIEIGTTYLNILFYRYLKDIENPQSRLYCTIAAYNTGAGNVAKAFTGARKLKPAVAKINAMTPAQVYQHLKKHLPYDETRKYLVKVTERMDKYDL